MKSKILIVGMLGLGLALSSCNLDPKEDANTQSYTLPCANFVASANGDAFASLASYNLLFYYLSDNVTVSTTSLSLVTGSGRLLFGVFLALLHGPARQLASGPTSGLLHLIGGLLGITLRSLGPLVY